MTQFAEIYQCLDLSIDGACIFESEADVTVEIEENADSVGIVRIVDFRFEKVMTKRTWDDMAGAWVREPGSVKIDASKPELFKTLCDALDMKRLQESLSERTPRKASLTDTDLNDYHARVM